MNEQAEQILDQLKASGKITDADLMEALGLTVEFRNTVDVVVLLFAESMIAARYHGEDRYDDCWSHEYHERWTRVTLGLMKELGITTVRDLQATLGTVAEISKKTPRSIQRLLTWLWPASHPANIMELGESEAIVS